MYLCLWIMDVIVHSTLMNSYIRLFMFMFLQIYDVSDTCYCFTNGPTVLLLEKSCRSNRINLLTSDWFWFTAAADFPVKPSWFGSSVRKNTALVALLNTSKAFKISLGGMINTHLCWICRYVFKCLRFYSHTQPFTAKLPLKCAMREFKRHARLMRLWRQRQYKVNESCMQDGSGCFCDRREYSRRWGSDRNSSGFRTQRNARRTWWTLAEADRGDGHGLLLSSTILPFCLLYLCVMSSPSALRDTDLTFRIVPSPPASSSLWPPPHIWRREKFLTASPPMMTAWCASADFCCWSAPVRRLCTFLDKDIHPVTPSGWGVCTRRAE